MNAEENGQKSCINQRFVDENRAWGIDRFWNLGQAKLITRNSLRTFFPLLRNHENTSS
jgi:hypothetical protein